MMESADMTDSKSVEGNFVGARISLPGPFVPLLMVSANRFGYNIFKVNKIVTR